MMTHRWMMMIGLGSLLACDALGGGEDGADAAAKTEVAPAKVDAEKTLAEAEAEAEAKAKAKEAAEGETKAAAPDETPDKVVVEETHTPVEPELAPMSRPEPPFVALAAPPFAQTLRREAPVTQGPRPTLEKIADKRNAIIDEDAWFRDLGLRMPTWEIPNPFTGAPGDLPPEIPATYQGVPIAKAIDGGDFSIAFHAADRLDVHQLVVRNKAGDVIAAFDLEAYRSTPKDDPAEAMFINQELRWAEVRDGVLLICSGHRTYAKSSGGLNAFITALELSTGELLWQSAPLVCNSGDFLVRDGWIITGYGFTAEPDFLFVLDAKTGEQVEKIKVKSGPEVILEKDGKLYVRTYDRNMEFELR